jgi:hypothetical protein
MLTRNEPTNPPPLSNVGLNGFNSSSHLFNTPHTNSWSTANAAMSMKLDEMIKSLANVNRSLNIINESNKKFTKFMHDKTTQDQSFTEDITRLKFDSSNFDQKVSLMANMNVTMEKSIEQLTTSINRLILPILGDLLAFTALLNKDKADRTVDADLRSRIGRHKSLVMNALGGNSKQ